MTTSSLKLSKFRCVCPGSSPVSGTRSETAFFSSGSRHIMVSTGQGECPPGPGFAELRTRIPAADCRKRPGACPRSPVGPDPGEKGPVRGGPHVQAQFKHARVALGRGQIRAGCFRPPCPHGGILLPSIRLWAIEAVPLHTLRRFSGCPFRGRASRPTHGG